MDTKLVHMSDVRQDVRKRFEKATDADYKWFYCYFHGFDEWPVPVPKTVKLEED